MKDTTYFLETCGTLEGYGLDLTQERQLLSGRNGFSCPVLLIAGTQGARIFDLLQGFHIKFPVSGYEIPDIPVQCGYGDTVHIQAEEKNGEKHHFSDMEDACRYLAKQPDRVKICRIEVPAPILRRTEMRFWEIGENSEGRIPETASDCAGFLLVLPCAAGAPGDDMRRLCRFIREVRVLSGQTGIVLNHTEAGRCNTMLSLFIQEWLGTKAPCFKCSYAEPSMPLTVLESGAKLAAAGTDEADVQMLQRCLERIGEKTERQKAVFEGEAEENLQHADRLAKMAGSFRASVENAGVLLHLTLTAGQEKELRQDIDGMVAFLRDRIPEMIQEVVEQRGKEAKEDLRNLTGDYMEMVLNQYITALAERICREEWLPQVRQAFQKAVDDFYRLVKADPVLAERFEKEETAYLKTMSVNLGEYVNTWASGVGTVVTAVLNKTVRKLLLYKMGSLGGLLLATGIVDKAAKKAGDVAAYAVDEMIPPKVYGKKMAQMLQKNLTSMNDTVFDLLKDSMLPAVNEYSLRQYQGMVDNVCGALLKREEDYRKESGLLREKTEELEEQYRKLLTEERVG